MKHYRAHLSPVVSISASDDGQLFASVAEDGSAKVFDVVNFGAFGFHNSVLSLTISDRYDQHDKIGVHAFSVLLGPPAW